MKNDDFESKVSRAKDILDKLMDPSISLNKGMELYKEGITNLQIASKILQKAKIEFEEISSTNNKDNQDINDNDEH